MIEKRRTILMVSGNGPGVIDGVAHYTDRLLDGLAKARPDWRWIWLRRKRRWFTPPFAFPRGVPVLQPWHNWSPFGQRVAAAVVRSLRPDITHIQEQIHSFHETSAAAKILAATYRHRVATVHEIHPELKSCQWTAEVVGSADRVIANDRFTADKCMRFFARKPQHVLWSPSNLQPPATRMQRPGLVVTFGFLSAIKGLESLHRALKQARARVPNLCWRIVGPFSPDSDPHHAALARILRDDWIEFTGGRDNLNDPTLRTWLAEGVLMALPFTDGASSRRTTLQTAWAFGLPTITTPPAKPDDAVRPGENCITLPLDETLPWADAIFRVLTEPALAEHLAAGGRATAIRLGWEALVAEHLHLYDALLDRSRAELPRPAPPSPAEA